MATAASRLGDMLVKANLITEDQLRKALQQQETQGPDRGRIGCDAENLRAGPGPPGQRRQQRLKRQRNSKEPEAGHAPHAVLVERQAVQQSASQKEHGLQPEERRDIERRPVDRRVALPHEAPADPDPKDCQ